MNPSNARAAHGPMAGRGAAVIAALALIAPIALGVALPAAADADLSPTTEVSEETAVAPAPENTSEPITPIATETGETDGSESDVADTSLEPAAVEPTSTDLTPPVLTASAPITAETAGDNASPTFTPMLTQAIPAGGSVTFGFDVTGATRVWMLGFMASTVDPVLISPSGTEYPAVRLAAGSVMVQAFLSAPSTGTWNLRLSNRDTVARTPVWETSYARADIDFRAQASHGKTALTVEAEPIVDGVARDDLLLGARVTSSTGVEVTQLVDVIEGSTRYGTTFDLPIGQYTVYVYGMVDGEMFGSVQFGWVVAAETNPPTVTLDVPDDPGASGWYQDSVRPIIRVTDDSDWSMVYYRLNGGPVATFSTNALPVTISGDGVHTLEYWADDEQGNVAAHQSATFRIDTTAPSVDILSPIDGESVYVGGELIADFACFDAGSGIEECTGTVADGERLPTDAPGLYDFTVVARDALGRETTKTTTYEVIDGDHPLVTIGAGDIPAHGWINDEWTITITAEDISAVSELHWEHRAPDGTTTEGDFGGPRGSITLAESGVHVIAAWAVDEYGNHGEPVYETFRADLDGPEIRVSIPQPVGLLPGEYIQGQRLLADFGCSDELSGVAECDASVPHGSQLPTDGLGEFEFTVTASDVAGNVSTRVVTYRVVAPTAVPGAPAVPAGLPQTGADVLPGALAAAATLLLGGVLILIRRVARR
jgi:hypothetical protein